MKKICGFIFCLIAIFAVSYSVRAECLLDEAVFIGKKDPLAKDLKIKNVKFDQVPQFAIPSDYDPNIHILDMWLFNVELNKRLIGLLGASVWYGNERRYDDGVGFSNRYSGTFNISGKVEENDGVKTYTMREAYTYREPQDASNEAITELNMSLKNGFIISLQLTHPIFEVWKKEGRSRYLRFTGEHQTLCLKKGDFKL